MRRFLLRWLAPLCIAGLCFLAPVQAQNQNQSDGLRFGSGGGGTQTQQADDTPAPVFSYFVAVSGTLLILFTIVRPSRKQL